MPSPSPGRPRRRLNPTSIERVSPIFDSTYPPPPFKWPMSTAVFEMAVRASVASAEAFAHIKDDYDSWHFEAREQLEAVEECCEEIIELESFGLGKAAELRHAVFSIFWAARAAHADECSVCALEREHVLVLASAP